MKKYKIQNHSEYYLFWDGERISKQTAFITPNLGKLPNYQIKRLEQFIKFKPTITNKSEAEKIIKEFREVNNI